MTKEDLRNTKIYLSNEDDRRKFQEHCFKLGVKWLVGGRTIDVSESCYYISNDLILTHGYTECFCKRSLTQIFLDDVLSIPTEYKFEPFERVLVRDKDSEKWRGTLFSHFDGEEPVYSYVCAGSWACCIPYKGNEHLLGTTKNA